MSQRQSSQRVYITINNIHPPFPVRVVEGLDTIPAATSGSHIMSKTLSPELLPMRSLSVRQKALTHLDTNSFCESQTHEQVAGVPEASV